MLLTQVDFREIMETVVFNKMNEQNPQKLWWQPGLALFLKLSSWIAGPIIVAIFVGKWLDRKYHSEPWLFLATVGISFSISMVAMVRIGLREFKKIEEESKKNNSK